MRVKHRETTPSEILKNVQAEMLKDVTDEKVKKSKLKEFDLIVFCKLYKHQFEELLWNNIKILMTFLKKKKLTLNWWEFLLPEKEALKNGTKTENERQAETNPGLATMVQFMMQDKQISVLEERVLFWCNKFHENERYRQMAKEKIINGNKKIIFYFIKRMHFKLDHDEGQMLTEGYMEMIRMFEKFKPETNYKFLSYVQYSIIQTTRKCVIKEQNFIDIPLNILNQIYKLKKHLEEIGDDRNQDEEIKAWLKKNNISEKTLSTIKKYKNDFGYVLSADGVKNQKSGKDVPIEQLSSAVVTDNSEQLKKDEFEDTLKGMLTPDEFEVVIHLFGINGRDKINKKELGILHPEWKGNEINKLLNSAITKMRKHKEMLKNIL